MLVSVVMPLYDSEKYVLQAVESVRAQSHEDWELLVVDDASTDAGPDLVASVPEPRVRLMRLPYNQGPGAARNVALEVAKGEWVTVLDADDLYHRDRLRLLVEAGTRYGKGFVFIDRMVRWELPTMPPDGTLQGRPRTDQLRDWDLRTWLGTYRLGQPFFHASAADDRRVRYPDTRAAQDSAFMVRLVERNGLIIRELPSATYLYRRTPGSIMHTTARRLGEAEKTYLILAEEFPQHRDVLDAKLARLAAERHVLEFRSALADRRPVAALRALRTPGVLMHLARHAPLGLGGAVLRLWRRWVQGRAGAA